MGLHSLKWAIVLCLVLLPIASAETLQVTEEHPFLLNGSWVEAKELKTGDVLTTADGGQVRIKSVTRVATSGPFPVYNLEARVYHDFVAGMLKVVVHNSNSPGTAEEVLREVAINPEAKGAKSLAEMPEDVVKAVTTPAGPLAGTPRVTAFDELSESELEIFSLRAAQMEYRDVPLVAIYATDELPADGVINPNGKTGITVRNQFNYNFVRQDTVVFSLNSIAEVGKGYYIVAPFEDLRVLNPESVVGGTLMEFSFAGNTNLPDTTRVFSSADDAKRYIESLSGRYGWGDISPHTEISRSQLEEWRKALDSDTLRFGYGWTVFETTWGEVKLRLGIGDFDDIFLNAGPTPEKPFKVMDVGSGKGTTLLGIKNEYGNSVTTYGIVFEKTPGEAYAGVDKLLVGDAKSQVPDAKMDFVFSHWGAVYHDSERTQLLDKVITWLKPGGRAYLHYPESSQEAMKAVLEKNGIKEYKFFKHWVSTSGYSFEYPILEFTKPLE